MYWGNIGIMEKKMETTGIIGIRRPYGGFPKLGAPFWGGPYSKDYRTLGSILGSPSFGKLPYLLYGRFSLVLHSKVHVTSRTLLGR